VQVVAASGLTAKHFSFRFEKRRTKSRMMHKKKKFPFAQNPICAKSDLHKILFAQNSICEKSDLRKIQFANIHLHKIPFAQNPICTTFYLHKFPFAQNPIFRNSRMEKRQKFIFLRFLLLLAFS
jgi:hypothetical protein